MVDVMDICLCKQNYKSGTTAVLSNRQNKFSCKRHPHPKMAHVELMINLTIFVQSLFIIMSTQMGIEPVYF